MVGLLKTNQEKLDLLLLRTLLLWKSNQCQSDSHSRWKWKWLGATATQQQSGRPPKITESSQWMLRCIEVARFLQLPESITTGLQTSHGLQISSTPLHRELHGIGFHGWATVSKPYIMRCKRVRCSGDVRLFFMRLWPCVPTNETPNALNGSVRQFQTFHAPNFVGIVWGWPLPVPTWPHTSAQHKLRTELDEWVWCGRT